ncbi:hypothetical protein ACFYTC_14345 [Actinomadura nitritigenes]|uniref:hypothetical protein n=1 Tax=Actinomadura nitritigenes TaxID=134602 RepID=UPI0036C2C38D
MRSTMATPMRADPHALNALRRADVWYAATAGHPVLLSIESFDEGFIARPAASPPSVPDRVLIIDRDTGALILWPAYDTATLIRQYHAYKNGTL